MLVKQRMIDVRRWTRWRCVITCSDVIAWRRKIKHWPAWTCHRSSTARLIARRDHSHLHHHPNSTTSSSSYGVVVVVGLYSAVKGACNQLCRAGKHVAHPLQDQSLGRSSRWKSCAHDRRHIQYGMWVTWAVTARDVVDSGPVHAPSTAGRRPTTKST